MISTVCLQLVEHKPLLLPALVMECHMFLQLVKLNSRFQRVVVTRDEALVMFQENRFKVEIISGLPQDAVISLYRCTA